MLHWPFPLFKIKTNRFSVCVKQIYKENKVFIDNNIQLIEGTASIRAIDERRFRKVSKKFSVTFPLET